MVDTGLKGREICAWWWCAAPYPHISVTPLADLSTTLTLPAPRTLLAHLRCAIRKIRIWSRLKANADGRSFHATRAETQAHYAPYTQTKAKTSAYPPQGEFRGVCGERRGGRVGGGADRRDLQGGDLHVVSGADISASSP